MSMTFAKAGAMAKALENVDKPFYIDDNVMIKVLTNTPVNRKIIGFEFKWKDEEPVKFLIGKEKGRYATILLAWQGGEKFLANKK